MRKFYYSLMLCLFTTFGYAQSYITEIGQTFYDLQTNATIGTRVIADNYGVSAVWTQGFNAPGFSDRGTGYNHWNPATGTWGNIPTSRLESFRTGWPSVVHTHDGTEWVFAHNGIGIQSLKRDLANDGPWQEMGYIPAAAPEAILWNRACAGGTDGNTIHLLASTTYNGITIGGLDQQILYYRSQDAGASWDIVDVTFPGMVPPMWGFQGDSYAMAANGNTVAVAIFGDLQDSYVWISNDNGDNWTQYLLNDFPLDNYQIDSGMDINGDGVEDRITSTNTSGSVAVDVNGVVHVSFATMDFTDIPNVLDNSYNIFRASGEIKYWNSAMAGAPMDASDDFIITAGVAPDLIGDVNIFSNEIAAYGNAGLVNHPNVVMGDNGEIYILYDAVKDGTQQDGLYRRHLFMVKSTDGGMSWTSPSDLTQNLDGVNWEYNYACAAPYVFDGKIHMTAQRDLNPGFTTNTSETNMNSIVYVAVDAATLTSIINGCTDPAACNFTPEATVDNGTCIVTPTPEVCDGIDNDCSGIVDDGVMITWNQDFDADGYGSSANGTWVSCNSIPGYVMDNSDCNDNLITYEDMDGDGFGSVIPAPCGSDNNLDCNDSDPNISYDYYVLDADQDGYVNFNDYYAGCLANLGYILYIDGVTASDCNDSDPMINGESAFVADFDGDGYGDFNDYYWGCSANPGYFMYVDGVTEGDCDIYAMTYLDNDGDGFGGDFLVGCGGVYNSDDCNDFEYNADNGDYYIFDADADGYGNFYNYYFGCYAEPGYIMYNGSALQEDCNDNDPTVAGTQYYVYDADADGFGNFGNYYAGCNAEPGFILYEAGVTVEDCDDYNLTYLDTDGDGFGSDVWAPCSGVYNSDDCDDNLIVYQDLDGDGAGSTIMVACGGSLLNTDCDDLDPFSATNAILYYADYDGDGFGTTWDYTMSCSQIPGYVLNGDDCYPYDLTFVDNDGDGLGGSQLVGCGAFNDIDCNDNDASVLDGNYFVYDMDADGYGDFYNYYFGCSADPGYIMYNGSALQEDCNDSDPSVGGVQIFVADFDGDGFGDFGDYYTGCSMNPGYMLYVEGVTQSDCDIYSWTFVDADGDGFGNVNGELAGCSGIYNTDDCDDNLLLYWDGDLDGVGVPYLVACGGSIYFTDCDDFDPTSATNATHYYADADGDGFGVEWDNVFTCYPPAGYVLDNSDCYPYLWTFYDVDGDGFGSNIFAPCGLADSSDCNDLDANINVLASEFCNGWDDNCNVEVDEFVQTEFFADMDNDGFGDINNNTYACDVPAGYTLNSEDCDDNLQTYQDVDMDGFGSTIFAACGVLDSFDCDDANAMINPSSMEICNSIDENCNGTADEGVLSTFWMDMDMDGFGDAAMSTLSCSIPVGFVNNDADCNDQSASISPIALEVCDIIDNNCNGTVDEGVQTLYFADTDNDGFGDVNNNQLACSAPAGFVQNATDCNDTTATTYPGATEVCNEIDDNCNVDVDEGVQTTFFMDMDVDGFGDGMMSMMACTAPNGFVIDPTDCDDMDVMVNPMANEICNNMDDNCNVEIDEFVLNTYYHDMDGDGFGNLNDATFGCTVPAGYVINGDDCDDAAVTYQDLDADSYGSSVTDACGVYPTDDCNDADASVNPGATEVCNDLDDNCNIEIDEFVLNTYYHDIDGDGFGNLNDATFGCSVPAGYVVNSDDCDDAAVTYQDLDADSYGSSVTEACGVYLTDDCNDADPNQYPTAVEICDNADQNCDGVIDEGLNVVTYYSDADGDAYGTDVTVVACIDPGAGYALVTGDCDDTDAAINPGATEVVDNAVDENCDGVIATDISSIELQGLNVYPNPSNGVLNIILPQSMSFDWSVINMTGSIVEKGKEINQNQLKWSNIQWENGIYQIIIHGADGQRFTAAWLLQK